MVAVAVVSMAVEASTVVVDFMEASDAAAVSVAATAAVDS
jgi:hypothetical protein